MTTLELKLNLPDGLVKQAKGAGPLTPKATERPLPPTNPPQTFP